MQEGRNVEAGLCWPLPPSTCILPSTWTGKTLGQVTLLYLIFKKVSGFGWDLRSLKGSWGWQSGGQPRFCHRPAGLTGKSLAEGWRLPLA